MWLTVHLLTTVASQEKLCEILTLNDDIFFGEKLFEKYYHFGLIFRRIPQVERL